LRIARISAAELKKMLDAGENIQIVDLRSAFEYDAEPQTLPGALHFDPKEIEKRVPELAQDRDVILYCT
jgi:rhodanese-related sulfurtransferase